MYRPPEPDPFQRYRVAQSLAEGHYYGHIDTGDGAPEMVEISWAVGYHVFEDGSAAVRLMAVAETAANGYMARPVVLEGVVAEGFAKGHVKPIDFIERWAACSAPKGQLPIFSGRFDNTIVGPLSEELTGPYIQ